VPLVVCRLQADCRLQLIRTRLASGSNGISVHVLRCTFALFIFRTLQSSLLIPPRACSLVSQLHNFAIFLLPRATRVPGESLVLNAAVGPQGKSPVLSYACTSVSPAPVHHPLPPLILALSLTILSNRTHFARTVVCRRKAC
jgi:hypothetical protein